MISLMLTFAIMFVFVIGNSFRPVITADRTSQQQDNSLLNNITSVDLSYADPDKVAVPAETETEGGKSAESLAEGLVSLRAEISDSTQLEKAVADFRETVSDSKAAAVSELDSTDNGSQEYIDYRETVIAGYDKLIGLIDSIDADNAEAVIGEIGELVSPEKPVNPLPDELPFRNIADTEISTEEYSENTMTAYLSEGGASSQADLEFTNDAAINDDIRAEFEEFTTPLEIYQYIRNNYSPEFYYGSRKGSVGAFAEKAGNDYDLSSLLIAVLRDRGIPSRYVKGEIEITADQAKKWTAVADINVALRIISSLGIPATGLINRDGEITAVRMEHVWTEAYVPYTDYRGAGNNSGKSMWIPLDPSFKEMRYEDGVKLDQAAEYVNDPANIITADTEVFGENIGSLADADPENSALIKYMLENGYGEATMTEAFGGRTIVTEDLGYLPLTLPYGTYSSKDTFDDVPASLTDTLSFRLYGNSAFGRDYSGSDSINYTFYAPDVYGKRIVLNYVPASETDEKVLEEYGNIFSAPAYLLKLKPQLVIDGNVVAEGNVVGAGYMQKYNIHIHNGSPRTNDSDVSNNVTAGGMYCIAMDYGHIASSVLEASANYIDAMKTTVSEENIYDEAVMGEMLHAIAMSYFGQLDIYNSVLAGQKDVTDLRDLSIGIVGFGANTVYTFERPSEINEGGFFLDIGHDVHSTISNTNTSTAEKEYMLQSGIYASAMEHGILEQVTGVESVSTIKSLQYAAENDIPMHIIVKENLDEELAAIRVSQQVKQDIRSAVNSGKLIVIPEEEMSINQWNGVGYMVLDTDTYACGYMISGGLSGGAMTIGEMLGEYVQYVIVGAITTVLTEILKTVILAMCPCGWVAAISFIIKAAEFIMLIKGICDMVELVANYIETGNIRYLQELLVQLASMATLSLASKLFGNKLNQLKEKINKAIDDAGLAGKCFVAGTPISTPMGLIAIENLRAGMMVYSFDPDTLDITEKEVEDVFVKQSDRLVDLTVNNELIKTTPDHPFYVPKKGFVKAIELRAGDMLFTLNGEYVVVEAVQHEILETPVKVYNFRVADLHTYFVGKTEIGTHNTNCKTGQTGQGSHESSSTKYDEDGNYTGGRTEEELASLADDPAHRGSTRQSDILKAEQERRVGLRMEEQGKLEGPITRDPNPAGGEFIDANNQVWDVKQYRSDFPPKSGGYTVEGSMESIMDSLNKGENVIVDTSHMTPEHIAELTSEVNARGLADKVLFCLFD